MWFVKIWNDNGRRVKGEKRNNELNKWKKDLDICYSKDICFIFNIYDDVNRIYFYYLFLFVFGCCGNFEGEIRVKLGK